jgi:hypothetical protein
VKEKSMRFLSFLLAAPVLIMVSADGYAADYELVGFTTATFDGGNTISGFTGACQTEFAIDTRMCNSVEVMETVNIPSLPATDSAWVRPVYVASEAGLDQDASGLSRINTAVSPLACTSVNSPGVQYVSPWTDASDIGTGLLVFTDAASNFSFALSACSSTHPVACCGPVPQAAIASVPFIGLFGRGLMIALALSAGGAMLLRGGRAAALIGKGDPSLRG